MKPLHEARWPRLALLALALSMSVASAQPSAGAPATHRIVVENMVYAPSDLTVHQGDQVVWVNEDMFPHTATGAGLDSGEIASHGSWNHVADKPGDYDYGCNYHPGMRGHLRVKP